MAEEARPKLSIKTERPAGQHAVPPSPTTLLDNGASRAAEPAPAPRVSSFAACFSPTACPSETQFSDWFAIRLFYLTSEIIPRSTHPTRSALLPDGRDMHPEPEELHGRVHRQQRRGSTPPRARRVVGVAGEASRRRAPSTSRGWTKQRGRFHDGISDPAYYAQYYAHLGMTGMAPYQVMPNGLVPPSPRAPASPPQDAFAHHASPLMMSSGGVSTDSGKTSSSSSPGASNAPSPMSGFFRPSVPTSTVSGYGMAAGSPLDGKHRRSSRGGRGSRAARARRRSAERAGQNGDGGDESNGGE
jgi:hypothetical protein